MRVRAVAVVAAAAALAGCTSSAGGGPTPPATPIGSTPPVTTTPAAPVSTPAPSSAAPTTSLPPHLSKPPLTTLPPTSAPATPAERSTCTRVTVRVIPGGAEHGREFAALQFTNAGTARCVLVGYPAVTLLRSGKRIGEPSEPASAARSRRDLAPGATAESDLFSYTQNCQAPLSDAVRVVVPGTAITMQRPQFVMRACLLRVEPLGAPE